MVSWRDVLNFDVISSFVKRITGVEIDDELKELGFKELSEKYSEEEIYEMEAAEIEQELIKIYLDILKDRGVKVKKRVRMPFPIGVEQLPPIGMDPQYIKNILREYPELRKLLEELLEEEDEYDDEDDYDSDDRANDMYI